MAGGDPDDIRRSLRRYVALLLNSPPWTVRLQRTRVSDDERPVAIIDPQMLTTVWSRAGMRSGPSGDQQKAQPFAITCYPVLGDTAAAASEIATTLAHLLDAGFSRGLVTDDVPAVRYGAPWRIPVWDYVGVPVSGPGRAGPASSYAHASVDQFNVRPIQDPLDELRFTVVANLRVTWWAAGLAADAAPLAGGITTGGWRALP